MNIIMNDLIELMDPHYIEVWVNSLLEVAFQLILIQTMVARIQNMKKWQNIA